MDFDDDDDNDFEINTRPAPRDLNALADRAWKKFNAKRAIGLESRRTQSHDDSE